VVDSYTHCGVESQWVAGHSHVVLRYPVFQVECFSDLAMKDGKKRFKLAWISGEGFVPGTFLYLCRLERNINNNPAPQRFSATSHRIGFSD
jgi:hypothetical protein